MNERIKKLRRELDLTQQEFADKISVKRGAIANYEIGRNVPSDSVVSLICREFNVNEEWLRNGTGEMFKAAPTDELDALAEKYSLTHRDYVFIEYLLKNADARRSMEKFCIEFAMAALADNIPEDTSSMPSQEPFNLELGTAALEEEYIKSRSGSASSADSSASNTTDGDAKERRA